MEDAKAALLRAAEQALEQKNFPDVVKNCKQILKQDRASYGAYVLLAKALQGTNHFPQALVALRKAVEQDKSALPAWLAFMDLYEASAEFDKFLEACNTVRQITQTSGDMKNFASCTERLASTYVKTGRHEEALGVWEELLKADKVVTPDTQLRALCGVIDAQASLFDLATQQKREKDSATLLGVHTVESLRDGLETNLHIALQKPGLHVERYNALLLDLLLRTTRESRGKDSQLRLLQQAIATTLSSNVLTGYEVALVLCEEDHADFLFQNVNSTESTKNGVPYFRLRLGLRFAHLYPSHGLALATIASLSQSSADRKKVLCEKALRADDTCLIGWQLLADLQIAEGAYSGAADSIKRGFKSLELWRTKYGLQLFAKELRLHLTEGHLHLETKAYEEAERVYRFVLDGADKLGNREAEELVKAALEGRVKVAIAQDDLKETEDRLEALLSFDNTNHWALAEKGWLDFKKGNAENAVHLLEKAVAICGNNSTYRRRLGLSYWETGEQSGKERAVAQLVEAARLDPKEAGVFRYLGHYYYQIAGDMRRAARSYQKAINLDPEDLEAGEALCNLLEKGGQIVLEGAICREASQHSPRAYWAWRRLGYIQVQAKQWSEAVSNLQHALRGYSSDGCLWEALGLAYQQLGMLTAALKAYERVVSLGNTSPIFALLQSGIILQSLASYTQAIDIFRNALDKVPGNVVAQCGLAAALLGRARQCTSVGALAWAARLLQEAADAAHQCTSSNGTVAAAWKLLGDIEVAYAQILPCDLMDSISDGITREDFNEQEAASFCDQVLLWYQQRKAASKRAQRAYLHLLHICPQQGHVYGDLAMAIKLDHSLDQNAPPSESTRLDPERTVLSGLRLDTSRADLWFIFGVLVQHKALKQHAFIQALRLDAYHSSTWAHLGQLYLQERELELAKQAFDRSRSADPTLSLPWAGMAFLHSLSDGKKEMDEAFASCLYAVHLLPVMQVQLGLARLAERTRHLSTAQVYAAIEQCVQRAPHSVEALNLKGLVCESRGSLSTAISAFQLARHIIEEGLGKTNSTAAGKLNCVLLNLARVLCKAGRARDAVQVYEILVDSGVLMEEPEALRSYAVAAWLGNRKELAAAIAQQAVEVNGESASHTLFFRMTYWLSRPLLVLEDLRRASMDLFRNMIFGSTALAMAIMADHQQSVAGVLYRSNILFDHERGPQAHHLVADWKQGKHEEGHLYNSTIEELLKAMHSFPDSISTRAKLGQKLTESTYGNCAYLSLRCCDVPGPVPQQDLCTSLVGAVLADATNAEHSVLPKLLRWVHMEPWNKTAKSSLVLTLQQLIQRCGLRYGI
uniref:Superkiller protein 3 n=1 Tax=Physcomitrium patens TaxID=3218 RepID=A0A7I4FVI3_PHYPA